jgi:RNA polymerase sigma-70 factor, ECF subfamily
MFLAVAAASVGVVVDSTPTRIRISRKRLRQLLDEIGHGRSEALAAVLNMYRPYLLATARARLEIRLKAKAAPSDLVQETVAEAHQAWSQLKKKPESEEEVRAWLRNILLERLKALRRRYYRAECRSLRRERSLDEGESKKLFEQLIAGNSETPSERFDREALVDRLREALDRLPPANRQVILWRNRDGWPFAKIGKRMDRSADAARMLYNRSMRLLKKALEVNDGDR